MKEGKERKVKKRTIVFFILAVLCVYTAFTYQGEEESSNEYTWADAIFVEDGKVLPENEGKLVAVSGSPVMIEGAHDEQIGVDFPSPSVYRAVELVKYSFLDSMGDGDRSGYRIRRIYQEDAKDGLDTRTIVGRVGLGEFELDEDLIIDLPVVRVDVEYSTFSQKDADHMLKHWNESRYGGRFCITEVPSYEDLDRLDEGYDNGGIYKGDRIVWWNMWIPSKKDKVTAVGIQRGSTLTYCDELKGSSTKGKIVTADKVKKDSEPSSPMMVKIVGILFTILFIYLGIRSMSDKPKEGRKKFKFRKEK